MTSLTLQPLVLLACLCAAYGLSWGLSLWMARAGEALGVVSHVTDRSSHTRPTSRMGGVGLAAGFLIPALIFVTALSYFPRSPLGWGGNVGLIAWLLAGGLGMFLVGLADDLWDLPPSVKLSGQIASLIPLACSGLRFIQLDPLVLPGLFPASLSILFAMGWVLFFVNVFNFMDGMDGFAARFAMNVALWFFLIAILKAWKDHAAPDIRIELMLVPILGAACAGFLKVNNHPARVFMGDSGSHFIGYLLALLPILSSGAHFTARIMLPAPEFGVPPATAFILLLPFIFDPVLTILRRAHRRENLLAAHRSHLYQRLMILGMSHKQVLSLNVVYFRVCALLAAGYAFVPLGSLRIVILLLALSVMTHYWWIVASRERKAPEIPKEGAKE